MESNKPAMPYTLVNINNNTKVKHIFSRIKKKIVKFSPSTTKLPNIFKFESLT